MNFILLTQVRGTVFDGDLEDYKKCCLVMPAATKMPENLPIHQQDNRQQSLTVTTHRGNAKKINNDVDKENAQAEMEAEFRQIN